MGPVVTRSARVPHSSVNAIGAIGALMNRVLQPRPLVVLGLNVWMGTAAGADELVETPAQNSLAERPRSPISLQGFGLRFESFGFSFRASGLAFRGSGLGSRVSC